MERTVGGSAADEVGHAERPEQLHRQDADLRAGSQGVACGLDGLGARAHDHDDALGIRRAVIFEQPMRASRERGEAVHRALHDVRRRVVVAVDGLAALEEDVRVLRRSAQHGTVGRQPARARRVDEAVVDHRPDDRGVERRDLLQLVRRAEAVTHLRADGRGERILRNPRRAPADLRGPRRRGVRLGGHQPRAGAAHQPRIAHPRRGLSGGVRDLVSALCRVVDRVHDRAASGHLDLPAPAAAHRPPSAVAAIHGIHRVVASDRQHRRQLRVSRRNHPFGFIATNAASYLRKLAMAVLLTPLIYLGHAVFRRVFAIRRRTAPSLASDSRPFPPRPLRRPFFTPCAAAADRRTATLAICALRASRPASHAPRRTLHALRAAVRFTRSARSYASRAPRGRPCFHALPRGRTLQALARSYASRALPRGRTLHLVDRPGPLGCARLRERSITGSGTRCQSIK